MDMADGIIGSRGDFQAAFRLALAEAADGGGREMLLVDPDFSDWPLGEPDVVELFSAWAQPHRRLVVLAGSFSDFRVRHARWVNWRRTRSHVVDCRIHDEQDAGQLPTLLLTGRVGLRVVDTARWRGRLTREPADLRRWADAVDALLQRSTASFPVTTLGL